MNPNGVEAPGCKARDDSGIDQARKPGRRRTQADISDERRSVPVEQRNIPRERRAESRIAISFEPPSRTEEHVQIDIRMRRDRAIEWRMILNRMRGYCREAESQKASLSRCAIAPTTPRSSTRSASRLTSCEADRGDGPAASGLFPGADCRRSTQGRSAG